MGFKPLFDKLLIKPDPAEEVSKGGILLPDNDEKPCKGVVVAAGEGYRNEDGQILPMDVKVGDHVVFGKYIGTEVEIDGEKFLIIEEENIMGVIE